MRKKRKKRYISKPIYEIFKKGISNSNGNGNANGNGKNNDNDNDRIVDIIINY